MPDNRTPAIRHSGPQQSSPTTNDSLPTGAPFINPNMSAKQDGLHRPFISDHHNNGPVHPPFVDHFQSQSNLVPRTTPLSASSLQQRRRNFLTGLSNLMSSRGTPLPPSLTGIPYPLDYDPSNSPWKNIESSPTEIGSFRLADRDVDLFKLWGLVLQAGGSSKVCSQNVHGLIVNVNRLFS
jgi:SWI/SNF chromatin-remodeling complex subunit SWI1